MSATPHVYSFGPDSPQTPRRESLPHEEWEPSVREAASKEEPRRALLGGKGASLQRLAEAGFPTPPGFTLSTTACNHFLRQGEWPKGLVEEVRQALGQLQASVTQTPLLVSVRSGAAVSMPGMMDTQLNVPVDPEETLWKAIEAVARSWNNARAVAYRAQQGIDPTLGTAVTVQTMFPAEFAGVIFTRDPQNVWSSRFVIESVSGLGESLVSGEETPTRITASWNKPDEFNLTEDAAGRAPPQEALVELTQMALAISKQFIHNMDIEWAWADGKLTILQFRPMQVTQATISQEEIDDVRQHEIAELEHVADDPDRLYALHNLDESLAWPTPLTWDLIRVYLMGHGFYRLYRLLGYRPAKSIRTGEFLHLIAGRIYADTASLANLFWDGIPLSYDDEAIIDQGKLGEGAPTQFQADAVNSQFLWKLPGNLWSLARLSGRIARRKRNAAQRYEKKIRPTFLAYVEEKQAQDLSHLTVEELVAELSQRCEQVLADFGAESLIPGFLASHAFDSLRRTLVQLGGQEQGEALAFDLVSGLPGDAAYEQHEMLEQTAQENVEEPEFLAAYGHRGPAEMELAEPRWSEDPARFSAHLAQLRSGGVSELSALTRHRRRQAIERREAATAELPDRLAVWGGSSFTEEVERHRRDALRLLPYRELAKNDLLRGYALIRIVTEELGRRLEIGSGVYYLNFGQLVSYPLFSERISSDIEERQRRRRILRRIDFPDVVTVRSLQANDQKEKWKKADRLVGSALAGGAGEGAAHIAAHPGDVSPTEPYVLVCRSTDPSWTPQLLRARGLVVEHGGALSHGAIIARELGVPAIACEGATQRIPPGAAVQVDGDRGIITLLRGE